MTLYNRFKITDFTLRDYLALERTIMSNERTMLAYLRTGMALMVAGITGLHLFVEQSWIILSAIACVSGTLVVLFGFKRFFAIKHRLNLASPDKTADVTAAHVSDSSASNDP